MRKTNRATATLPEALRALDIDRNAFNYFEREDVFETRFEKSKGGSPRPVTRDNLLELGFIAALTSCGLRLAQAQGTANVWRKKEQSGSLKPLFVFRPVAAGFLANDEQRRSGYFEEDVTVRELGEKIGPVFQQPTGESKCPPATTLCCINIAEIVRRVDAILDEITA